MLQDRLWETGVELPSVKNIMEFPCDNPMDWHNTALEGTIKTCQPAHFVIMDCMRLKIHDRFLPTINEEDVFLRSSYLSFSWRISQAAHLSSPWCCLSRCTWYATYLCGSCSLSFLYSQCPIIMRQRIFAEYTNHRFIKTTKSCLFDVTGAGT